MNLDTICAPITPLFMSAVGVIRISGPKAFEITEKIFEKSIINAQSHTLHHGILHDENGNIVDDVVVSVYKAPHSYTGEDVIEISCHGSVYIINKIQKLIISFGARLALNGEFSKRAFLNGKLDMAQAEAVIDLIESESEAEADIAVKQLKGFLSKEINSLREELIGISAQILAYIDFPDDEIEDLENDELFNKINAVYKKTEKLKNSFETGELIKNGAKACIIGKPNVGKSYLMNRILKRERSIVTDIAGTTRDVIEEPVFIGGIKMYISDTAGIRDSDDVIEKIGIHKTSEKIEESDLLICVFDASSKIEDYDYEIDELLIKNKTKKIAVINKIDLDKKFDENLLKSAFDKVVYISAKENKGLDLLEMAIKELFNNGIDIKNNDIITNMRQFHCLLKASEALKEALDNSAFTPDITLISLEAAIEAFSMITGKSISEEIVENIFSRFCVGK